jgi:uncharacterized protein YukE
MTAAEMWGADVKALEQLGRDLDAAAERLASIQNRLRVRIYASPWGGLDAERFGTDWDGVHRAALAAAAVALRTAGETVRRNALEQGVASAADGGAGSGVIDAPGPPGGGDPLGDVISGFSRLAHLTHATADWMTLGGSGRFSPRWPAGTTGGLGGQFRDLGDMPLWERLKAVGKDENWVAKPYVGEVRGTWESVGKWAGGAEIVLSFAEGAYGQWTSDADKSSLSTDAKVARATATGATTAAGGLAGAWAVAQLGGALGSLGGPVGAAAGVVVGGAIGGFVGSGAGEAVGHFVADDAGKIGDAVGEGLHSAGSWVSHHNPFG